MTEKDSKRVSISMSEMLEDMEEKLKLKEDMVKQIGEKNEQLDNTNITLVRHNKELKDENSKLKTEIDTALSRLSKIAGQKLSEENPTITDLGNPNRPAKIGEKWSTLYTDEWTDLYEDISINMKSNNELDDVTTNDGFIEKKIMKTVEWCYNKCMEIRKVQKEEINKMLWSVARMIHCLGTEPSAHADNNTVKGTCDSVSRTLLSAMEPFKEVVAQSLNQCSTTQITSVKKKCVDDYQEEKAGSLDSEILFVEKCCELCWYMCITDPQMVIEYDNVENSPMDTNRFNQYDRTGSVVEYVIWPALLLHKNGPVLSKGTTQVYFEQEKKRKRKESLELDASPSIMDNSEFEQDPEIPTETLSKEKKDLEGNAFGVNKDIGIKRTCSVETTQRDEKKSNNLNVVKVLAQNYESMPPPPSCVGSYGTNKLNSAMKNEPYKNQTENSFKDDDEVKGINGRSHAEKCNSITVGDDVNDMKPKLTKNEEFDPARFAFDSMVNNENKENANGDNNQTDGCLPTATKDKVKSSNTKYYIKREESTDKLVKHSGETLKRSLDKNLRGTILPRQLSSDKNKNTTKTSSSDI